MLPIQFIACQIKPAVAVGDRVPAVLKISFTFFTALQKIQMA